ncbi:MAG: sigma-54 dependent transcriptional regulator [Planctomycetaceae bacterium]|jgi:transcriptional regulator with GAF, ATPase, and Fis domain|nr:sigma-54 dependent transcriptional regulator [Planctomycetaceae bacterium]
MDSIVGHNAGLRSVLERAGLVAKSDVPVLILGETGSGKEVFARHIHEQSRRVKLPFIKVNCGAVPSELIDSYLFGHERGAFTGAMEKRKGWFESANGGTLLLDEIGELPLAAQVRFLRVLQDGSFESVGGSGKTIRVDVRVIAATHRNLRQMVNEGKFREDLWYRISVFPIRIPPLRERMEDLTELAFYFAKRAVSKFGLPEINISCEDINILSMYKWPGNIREFGAVMDRAVLLGEGRRLALVETLRELRLENESYFDPTAFSVMENLSSRNIDRSSKVNDNNIIDDNSSNDDSIKDIAKDSIDTPPLVSNSTNDLAKEDSANIDVNVNADVEVEVVDGDSDVPLPVKELKSERVKLSRRKKNQEAEFAQQQLESDKLTLEISQEEQDQLEAKRREAEIANFISLNDAVKRHIEAALDLTNGIIEGNYGTAALLKVNPHTLRAKMRRLGITWSKFRKS